MHKENKPEALDLPARIYEKVKSFRLIFLMHNKLCSVEMPVSDKFYATPGKATAKVVFFRQFSYFGIDKMLVE